MSQQSGIFVSNSSSFQDVPVPSGNNITLFLNVNDSNKLYGMKSNRSVFPIFSSGGVAPAYGYVASNTAQTVLSNGYVAFDAITNNAGVTLPAATDIKVAAAGKYRVDFVINIPTNYIY